MMVLHELGWGEGMDWIDLAQDKKKRWALMIGIINL
jgi:hypothetical protein